MQDEKTMEAGLEQSPPVPLTAAERQRMISTLELREDLPEVAMLAKAQRLTTMEVSSDTATANVDAGSLISFTAGVSPDHTAAALNTALLAQLNSDKLFNRFDKDEIMQWYQNYQKVMGMCGWTMQAFQFQNYQASGSTFTINAAIADLVASFLPGAEVAVVKAALTALENLKSDDPWYTVWDQSSHSADGGNFQIAAGSDSDGQRNTLVLKVSAYSFQTTETTTRFLWAEYDSSNTHLSYATQTMTLNEDVYDQVKQQIILKLGEKAAQNIGALDI